MREVGRRDHVEWVWLSAEDDRLGAADLAGEGLHEIRRPEDRGGHGAGGDRLLGVELGPQGGGGGVWGGEHVRDIRQATDAGQGGQLRNLSWSSLASQLPDCPIRSFGAAHTDTEEGMLAKLPHIDWSALVGALGLAGALIGWFVNRQDNRRTSARQDAAEQRERERRVVAERVWVTLTLLKTARPSIGLPR